MFGKKKIAQINVYDNGHAVVKGILPGIMAAYSACHKSLEANNVKMEEIDDKMAVFKIDKGEAGNDAE